MKLDFTKIPGYSAELTAEQTLDLVKGFELESLGLISKAVADKNASEAAEWKKKYRDTLSEQERKEAEAAEQAKLRDKELDELRRERDIGKATTKYLALGFDETLAAETAQASVNGDTDTVFANFTKHQALREAKLKEDLLKGTPTPPSGDPPAAASTQYETMAADAYARGDYSTGAYYTRLSQQKT